jgi:hypothetical protein
MSAEASKSSGAGCITALVGAALIYIGGWRAVWALPRWEASSHAGIEGEPPELLLESDCLAFRVGSTANARYYGIGFRPRFFHSSFLAWSMGLGGAVLLLSGLGSSTGSSTKPG